MEQATVETISEQELTGIALSGIIAEAVAGVKDYEINKWTMYEYAKCDIRALELSAGEYEAAIKLLTEALGI